MTLSNRRYDIDWIRVIAIGLLVIYHVAVGFQPWGIMIGFITTKKNMGVIVDSHDYAECVANTSLVFCVRDGSISRFKK
jgi:hypothetical protein